MQTERLQALGLEPAPEVRLVLLGVDGGRDSSSSPCMMQPPYGQGYGYGPPAPSIRQEVQLFAANGVYVTTARFTVGQSMYPIANITRIAQVTVPPSYGGAILAILFGLVLILIGVPFAGWLAVVGLAFLAGGIYTASTRKPLYALEVWTAGMNVRAVVGHDWTFIGAVHQALNQAIASR